MGRERAYHFGYGRECQGCEHRDVQFVRIGHVHPCEKVRWVGHRHVLPAWEDGRCQDFSPVDLPILAAETIQG